MKGFLYNDRKTVIDKFYDENERFRKAYPYFKKWEGKSYQF